MRALPDMTPKQTLFLDRDGVFQVQWLNSSSRFEVCLVKYNLQNDPILQRSWESRFLPTCKSHSVFLPVCVYWCSNPVEACVTVHYSLRINSIMLKKLSIALSVAILSLIPSTRWCVAKKCL